MIDYDLPDELLDYIGIDETDDAYAWLSEQIYGSEPIQTGGYAFDSVGSSARGTRGGRQGGTARGTRGGSRTTRTTARTTTRTPKLPERIRQLREFARGPEADTWSDDRLFVEEARLMADFEDDCPYTTRSYFDYDYYYPTYDTMSDQQLRGYFTWRAQVRRGTIEKATTPFAFVYIYELMNGIGVEPGEPAFRAIEAFWQSYRAFDFVLDNYVPYWLIDYVVYHGLDPKLVLPYIALDASEDLLTLVKAQEAVLAQQQPARQQPSKHGRRREPYRFGQDPDAEARLLKALDAVSTYKPLGARLYKDDPEALRSVTAAVFARLVRYYHGKRQQDLVESLFGVPYEFDYAMFDYAVVWQEKPHPNCVYELAETDRFTCRNGRWSCRTLAGGETRSSRMGQILRATDRLLRAALDHPYPLKDRGEPKYVVQLIEREIEDFMAWRQAHAVRRVEIDVSKLAGIRSAAAVTREALLVDEEREEAAEQVVEPEAPAAEAGGAANGAAEGAPADTTPETPLGLTPDELKLLEDLLANRKPTTASADLLVDAINEKLFDLVGDTVLEFGDSGEPSLIEDYVEDLRVALT